MTKNFTDDLYKLYKKWEKPFLHIGADLEISWWTTVHQVEVALIALLVSDGLSYEINGLRDSLVRAALLHDFGKKYVPKEIWLKRGSLEDWEWEKIKTHPDWTRYILWELQGRKINIPYKAIVGAFEHHEKENGDGYPKGKKGDQISEIGKILPGCDIFHAMICDLRPYRPNPLPQAERIARTKEIIERGEIRVDVGRIILKGCENPAYFQGRYKKEYMELVSRIIEELAPKIIGAK